jgi:aspartate carbamoyltransferase catalytic subunit
MNGRLRISRPYLLDSHDITYRDIEDIFAQADYYQKEAGAKEKLTDLECVAVALAFYDAPNALEALFKEAATRLGAKPLSFSEALKKANKRESLYDSLKEVKVEAESIFAVNHEQAGQAKILQTKTKNILINAGDGNHENPVQALLDIYTLSAKFGGLDELKGKKVVMTGDLLKNPVAHSHINILQTLACEVVLCGPETLVPRNRAIWNFPSTGNLKEALTDADILITHSTSGDNTIENKVPSHEEYSKHYSISAELMNNNPYLVVLHPGEVNYGVELDAEVINYPNCLIQEQDKSGIFLLMGLLKLLSKHLDKSYDALEHKHSH